MIFFVRLNPLTVVYRLWPSSFIAYNTCHL